MRSGYHPIRRFGLFSCHPQLVLPLTPEHQRNQVEWCREMSLWYDLMIHKLPSWFEFILAAICTYILNCFHHQDCCKSATCRTWNVKCVSLDHKFWDFFLPSSVGTTSNSRHRRN